MRGLAILYRGTGAVFGLFLALFTFSSDIATAQSQPTITDANISAETIVAVVDEKPITLGELLVLRQTLPKSFQELPDEVLLESLIKMAVDQQILANAAEAARLERSKRAKYAMKNVSREVLADVFVEEILRAGVTEERIAAIYEEKYVRAKPVIQVRAAHILVDDQTLAQDLRKRLDDGVDFSSLAADYGTDLTSSRGGDLGWQDTGDLLPAFAEAVGKLSPGEVDGPVRSPFGWHIVRLDERREKPIPPLDAVRDTIRKELLSIVRKAAVADAHNAASVKILKDAVPADAIRDDALILP